MLIARFRHGLKRIIEFVLLNVHALLARFLKLLEHVLRLIDAVRGAFQFHPAFAGGHFHTERVLKVLQKLDVVGVERLQSARALKLEGASFTHHQSVASGSLPIEYWLKPTPLTLTYRKPYTSAQCVRSSVAASTLTMIKYLPVVFGMTCAAAKWPFSQLSDSSASFPSES